MPIIEIKEVVKVAVQPSSEFIGFDIDRPVDGDSLNCYAIRILGWALTEVKKPVTVTASWKGSVLGKTNLGRARPDLRTAYPTAFRAGRSGFCLLVNLLGLPLEASIDLHANVADGDKVHIGTIRLQRAPLASGYSPSMRPILVNSIGRSGSKWLMMLLAQHPEIVALQPAILEPRAIHYWMSVFLRISNPNSYLQILAADLSQPEYWLGRQQPIHMADFPADATQEWLGGASVQAAADFCQEQVDMFYRKTALDLGQAFVRYFVEKHAPDPLLSTLVAEVYPGAREVFLTRDLRDVFCSMMSFNAKIGQTNFLSGKFDTDEQFMGSLRKQSLALLEEWQSRSADAFLVRYEDLILRPAETVAGILKYLGVSFTLEVVEGMVRRAATIDTKAHQTAANPYASIGRWQRDLSAELQAQCQESLGDILKEFGYS